MTDRFQRAAAALILLASMGLAGASLLQPALAASDATTAPVAPVVVELFTSQGCSSCPPAEAFLNELADEKGIIALEMHVDYWDYIGWADPFASPQITQRQRDYASQLDLPYVYTPQMVIDGQHNAVGSNRQEVRTAIGESIHEGKRLDIEYVEDGGDKIVISAGDSPEGGATVWLVAYDGTHETAVERGENSGRRLKNRNVVRELVELGHWTGERLEIPVYMDEMGERGRSGCAVLVQQGRTGPILGAAAWSLTEHH
jgi:hypothetical protein